ncbi:MAG: VCBS repeat-containing protein, partial [Desulfobulbaceae bacterium]|nr:VCBS repeat-containing protein [Desulfobulbaceae bacterium]
PAQQTAPVKGDSSFTTAHPDKTFMSSGGGFSIRGSRNFVKTRTFDMDLRGLDIGDVDGDGLEELVLASRSEVQVYRRDGTRLNIIDTIKMDNRYEVHNVNCADLNGNGRDEIYISAADPRIPGSRAVEWDGTKFVDLFNEARWYVKPVNIPDMGLVLVGQSTGLLPVEPGLYHLTLNGKVLVRQERLPIPNNVNLFNFAYADLDGDGQHEIIALDDSFKLMVIKGGTMIWRSQERFCGTKRFLGGDPNMKAGTSHRRNDEVDGIGDKYKEVYVPSRILISDVDKDGISDIILNRNPETLTTVVPRLIQYQSGTMVGLRWNGLGLEEMWRTRKIDGYLVDYQAKSQVMKLGTDDEDELFIGLILNAGTLDSLLSDRATVVIYPFEFEMPEENKQ